MPVSSPAEITRQTLQPHPDNAKLAPCDLVHSRSEVPGSFDFGKDKK